MLSINRVIERAMLPMLDLLKSRYDSLRSGLALKFLSRAQG